MRYLAQRWASLMPPSRELLFERDQKKTSFAHYNLLGPAAPPLPPPVLGSVRKPNPTTRLGRGWMNCQSITQAPFRCSSFAFNRSAATRTNVLALIAHACCSTSNRVPSPCTAAGHWDCAGLVPQRSWSGMLVVCLPS